MAITVNSGGAANSNNAAVASLACASFNEVNTGRIILVVVLGDITKSVSSITHNGTTETFTSIAAVNGTGVRVEYWRCDNPATKTGFIITANFSAAVIAAIAAEQYSGDVGILTRGTDVNLTALGAAARQAMVKSTDYTFALVGCVANSSDTLTASVGTLRQSSVGAAGGVGVAIIDSTQSPVATILNEVKLTANREFVAMPLGLQATATDFPYNEITATQLFGSVKLVSARMPLGGGGGILPPSGHGQVFPPPYGTG